jgi:hypothetical protein
MRFSTTERMTPMRRTNTIADLGATFSSRLSHDPARRGIHRFLP